jgi:hypothetical protein
MNINTLKIASIDRLIAHQVFPKTKTKDAYSVNRTELLTFSEAEKNILISRLEEALTNTSKTFQLEFEDKSNDSIFDVLKTISSKDEKKYITTTQELAENLASTHFRINIPGGYCLMGQGLTDKGIYFFFIIKAELQEAFNISSGKLNLLKDIFLSPAKDFYKIGFFIKNSTHFLPFMFDDQFSLQKKDLTEYFYSHFLGLTTEKNDKLKSKNFYDDTTYFIEQNVTNLQDRIGLSNALKVLYRENTSGIISAKSFSEDHLEGKLKTEYDKKIVAEKYPTSFAKINTLIDKRLQLDRITIPLSYNLSLTGTLTRLGNVEIIENLNGESLSNLQTEINTGSVDKLIVLKNI